MKKGLIILLMICVPLCTFAKAKEVQKADKNYDFKAVKKIVVLPMTSNGVDFGKVDADRLPKIQAILEKTKKNLRENMVVGAKEAKMTIPFDYKNDKKPTTLLLQYNFEKFDNGNFVARAVPFAGKAKVKLDMKIIDGKTQKVLAEASAEGKAQGGVIAGGMDSEVLWTAVNIANADMYKYLKKLTGLDYSFFSAVTSGKNLKQGFKTQVDVVKEEKKEKGIVEKKTKSK